MDDHTLETMKWLNERYQAVNDARVYLAHQPIYGFRKGHTEAGVLQRYTLTHQIMKALARLHVESLLDVGCSEGYKASLIAELFGIPTRGCDISIEACKRAREIYGLKVDTVDAQEMPYPDKAFDVVLCSEALEHISDWTKALSEIVRVARRAVLITVPLEPPQLVEQNRARGTPHAHIHCLNERSFDFLKGAGCQVLFRKAHNSHLRYAFYLVEASRLEHTPKHPRWMVDAFNASLQILQTLFGKRSAAFVMALDEFVSAHSCSNDALIVTILKDASICRIREKPRIRARQIIAYQTPLHYLKNSMAAAHAPIDRGTPVHKNHRWIW